jgi:acetyl esterase/lipase
MFFNKLLFYLLDGTLCWGYNMKVALSKIALAASISLALALTFSCSSNNDVAGDTSSSSDTQAALSSSSDDGGWDASSSSAPQVVQSSSSVLSSSSVAPSSSSRPSSSSAVLSSSSSPSSSSVVPSSSSNQSSSSVAAVSCTANRTQNNITYVPGSSNNRQQLNLKLPSSGNGPFPLIIFIHGGAFTGGDKTVGTPFSNGTNKGYATAALGYRLASSGAKAFPEAVEDLLAAIRHLRANAAQYCLDPDKFAVTGFSAGGYFTGLINAISGNAHEFNETTLGNSGVSSKVQAAVSCAALTDFTKLNDQQKELGGSWMMSDHFANGQALNSFFGMTVTVPPPSGSAIEAALKKSNPFTYVTSANCANIPPIMMHHGTSDNLVPWKQSEILVNKLNEVCGNGKAELVKHTGGHADCPSNQETAIFNFLDSKLGVKR